MLICIIIHGSGGERSQRRGAGWILALACAATIGVFAGATIGRFVEVTRAPIGSRLVLGDHSRFEGGP